MAKRTLGSLGTLVKEARGSRKLREVAAEIGISPPTLMRVENGRTPDIATFAKICMWLKIDPRELMGMDISKDEKGSNQAGETYVSAHLRGDRTPYQETLKALGSMIALAAKMQPEPNRELRDGDI